MFQWIALIMHCYSKKNKIKNKNTYSLKNGSSAEMEVVRFPPEANLNITTYDFDSLKKHSSKMFNILFEQFYVHILLFSILTLLCSAKSMIIDYVKPTLQSAFVD